MTRPESSMASGRTSSQLASQGTSASSDSSARPVGAEDARVEALVATGAVAPDAVPQARRTTRAPGASPSAGRGASKR